jgi:hypothetical protein
VAGAYFGGPKDCEGFEDWFLALKSSRQRL